MFLGASRSATIIRSAANHLRGMWGGLSELPAFEEQGGWRPGESLATRATSYPSSLVLIRPSGCERRSRARLIRANGTPVTGLAAVESHHTCGSLLEGVMPVASECVRRACVESPRSIMWGWCGRMAAPIGLGVQPTTITGVAWLLGSTA